MPAASPALDEGVALFNSGRFDEAEIRFGRAIKAGGAFEAYYFRALSRAALGRTAAAISDVESFLRRRPGHADAAALKVRLLLESARALKDSGRAAEALKRCRQALALEPSSRDGRGLEAALVAETAPLAQVRAAAARRKAGPREAAHDGWTPAKQARAEALLASGRRADVLAFARRAAAADPRALGPRSLLYRTLVDLGRYEEAFALGEALLDAGADLSAIRLMLWPWDPRRVDALRRPHLRALRRAAANPRWRPWAAAYSCILSGEPARIRPLDRCDGRRYGWLYQAEGRRWLEAGRWDRAIACLRRALSCRPDDWVSRGFIAEAEAAAGRPRRALEGLRRAIPRLGEEGRGELLAWLGGLELWLGEYARAARTLAAAKRLQARWAPCWSAGANLLLGRARAAVADADRALAINPRDEEAMVWRGEALRKLGRPRDALTALSGVGPSNPWGAVNRALAYFALGRPSGARAEMARIPEDLRRRFAREAPGASDEKALEAGLRLARGFRRHRASLDALWLGKGA